jgi:long-chain acyl-CoA synthetase
MTSVPLLLDRIAKGITAKITSGPLFKKCLFEFSASYKRKWVNRGYKTPILDALVFKKVAALIGGRMRFMVSGGAPLSAGTHEMIRNCLCVTMCQGKLVSLNLNLTLNFL